MKKYSLGDYLEMLNELYTLCSPSFSGSMEKQGKIIAEIAWALKKRGVLSFNGKPRKPEWKWVASMEPTKELARNIANDVSSMREKNRLAAMKRKAVNSLPAIPEPELQNRPKKREESPKSVWIEGTKTKVSTDLLDKLEDGFLVELLRQRGYTVSCTKTIAL